MGEPFGHFSQDAREYVITDPLAPPRAQINFLWNDTLISGLNQFGTGDGVFNNQTMMYKVMPDNPGHPSSVSGCEPYAFTNQYLGPQNGRSGDSISGWITGCAGWMFRAVVEHFCGLNPGYAALRIDPRLPAGWDEVSVQRGLRGRHYDIHIRRLAGGCQITCNGRPVPDGLVPY